MSDDAVTGVAVVLAVGLWLALVVSGVHLARKKNRSEHWMWFGVHPLGALIVFIVMIAVSPLQRCPHCRKKLPATAVACGYCRTDLAGGAPMQAGALTAAPPGRPEYTSVGGWLLFLCVSLTILSPIVNGVRLAQDAAAWDRVAAYPALTNILGTEMLLGGILVAFGVVAGISLWSRSPWGPAIARGFFVGVICYQVVMAFMVFGSDLPSFAADEIRTAVAIQVGGGLIAAAIWLTYLNRSKRVAALFPDEATAETPVPLSRLTRDAGEARMPAEPAPEVPDARRGGFGEPYCSETCYDAAGRLIADGLIQGSLGHCEFCGSSVDRRVGRVTGVAIPFHHRMLYVCTACDERGRRLALELRECSFCEKPLAAAAAPQEEEPAGV